MKHRDKAAFYVGKRVRSRFRAPWVGTVLRESDATPQCVYVRVELNRRGCPMRKPITKHINVGWLEILA